MAQNTIAPSGFVGDKLPSADAQAWAPSPDGMSTSNVNIGVSNDGKSVPNPSEYPPPSAPDISELPPNYFDISMYLIMLFCTTMKSHRILKHPKRKLNEMEKVFSHLIP